MTRLFLPSKTAVTVKLNYLNVKLYVNIYSVHAFLYQNITILEFIAIYEIVYLIIINYNKIFRICKYFTNMLDFFMNYVKNIFYLYSIFRKNNTNTAP